MKSFSPKKEISPEAFGADGLYSLLVRRSVSFNPAAPRPLHGLPVDTAAALLTPAGDSDSRRLDCFSLVESYPT